MTSDESAKKLKMLLKQLFQYEAADLDYGIPKLMNFKRKEIEKFVENGLFEATEGAFKGLAAADQKGAEDELKALAEKINEMDSGTIDGKGEVKKNKEMAKVKEYLERKKQVDQLAFTQSKMDDVYSNVYEFFNRYYEEGDFISKARDGGRAKYRVPYNGEEVLLHWATKDQYYVKTDENLKKHRFEAGSWHVTFTVVSADVEANNVKAGDRYFLLDAKEPELDEQKKELVVFFNYRQLTDAEAKEFGTKKKETQQKLIVAAVKTIMKKGSKVTALTQKVKVGEDEITLLEKQIDVYIGRNTTDYFIHKNLRGFLESELDFYLKNEVLKLDDIEGMDARHIVLEKAKLKAIREISGKIIAFLAQIEEFQKKLWEKKKFVLKTEYVVTIDKLPEDMVVEVLKNKAQIAEWEELGFGKISKKGDLVASAQRTLGDEDAPVMKKLPVDTKHFEAGFKMRLLAKLSENGSLDEQIDGLLVKSENWQALNVLHEKYHKKIKCIYIDPPYNTAASEILYKNNYLHSSWNSLIFDRITLGKELLKNDGFMNITIDYAEFFNLGKIADLIFSNENRAGIITIFINPKGRQHERFFSASTEYMLVYANDINTAKFNKVTIDVEKSKEFDLEDENGKYRLDEFARIRSSTSREAKSNFWYPIYVSPDLNELTLTKKKGFQEVYPINEAGEEFSWKVIPESFLENNEQLLYVAKFDENKQLRIYNKYYEQQVLKNIWVDKKYFPEFQGTNLLKDLFGNSLFSYPKSVYAVMDTCKIMTQKNEIVLDYFAGSGTTGHAILKLNKETEGGRRKFILVEMADYFDTVVVPRMKKVAYTLNWKEGKPEDADGQSALFKYIYLEQYEDALNNISFKGMTGAQQKTLEQLPDYVLNYMLDYESRESPSRLNIEAFEDPFNYQLKILSGGERWEKVDLVETFNYLMGLEVDAVKQLEDQSRKYVAVFGRMNGKRTAVVWRATKGLDKRKDKKFIEAEILKDYKAERIFVNGDSAVERAEPVEIEFKRRMGA